MKDIDIGYDDRDDGRVVGITAAGPGWWAVYRHPRGDIRVPVAAWVVKEETRIPDHTGLPLRTAHVFGVESTGDGEWPGMAIIAPQSQTVEYVYDPRPETLEAYLAELDEEEASRRTASAHPAPGAGR